MIDITVVTPTYNRAHTLPKVFESLMAQTYKDFEWLVVDDGSTDNTEELVAQYKTQAWFPVRYAKKEHAGKYEAVNLSYKLVTTPYIINCDSDDELLPNGLEIVMRLWSEVPKEKYENIWCVTARSIDSETREIVGPLFPENINDLEGKEQRKVLVKISGEKHSCRRMDIVKNYPYPTFPDTGKLVPNMTWTPINAKYDQYCSNEAVSVYYQSSPDSLAKSPSKERKLGYFYYAAMVINDHLDQFFYNPDVRWSFIHISRCGWRGGKSTRQIIGAVKGLGRKLMVIGCLPVSAAYNLFFDRHKKLAIK